MQVYISRLRKLLGADAIRTEAGGYRLALDADQVDAADFERLSAAGTRAPCLRSNGGSRRGVPRGVVAGEVPALADFDDHSWAQAEVGRLGEERLSCVEERFDLEIALGRHAELVAEVERLVAEHPLRECLRGQLMLALYRSGRQAEALSSYQTFRRLLADELGIKPSPELRDLSGRSSTRTRALRRPRPWERRRPIFGCPGRRPR